MNFLFGLRIRTLPCCLTACQAPQRAHIYKFSSPLIEYKFLDAQSFQTFRQMSTTSLKKTDQSADPFKKPSKEQLILIKEKLTLHLPKFLLETHPYNLYTKDVIFENFYQEPGKISTGALQYAIQLTLLRMKIHWRFSHARLEILNITVDDTEGTVKVRWRIVGVRGVKSMIQPWKIKAWNVNESIRSEAEWLDGFSILYVSGNGLIYKHTLQRVMSQKDEEPVLAEKNKKVQNLDINETICTKESGLK